jgi:CRP-like cAMP-binding protein
MEISKESIVKFISDALSSSNLRAPKECLENIADHLEPASFARNEFFVTEGKVNTHHFFMTEGFMRAFTHNPEGEEVTTNFFKKEAHVFEANSLFTQTRSMESIQAITHCEGFLLSFETSNKLFHTYPQFREFGRLTLVREFTAYKRRTLSLINQTAEERYADLINTNKEIFQYAQLKHIASYLGVTDSSLSRIRREFAKK